MSLPKADTFHQPSSPSTEDDPVVSIAHLSKRSTTYSRSSFANWLFNERGTAADAVADFEQSFSGARGPRPAARRRSAREFEDHLLSKAQHRASSPVDSGIGSSIGSPSIKNLSGSFGKALDLASNKDSALGDSVAASVTSESLIQDTNSIKAPRPNRANRSSDRSSLTIIHHIPCKKNTGPSLSSFARRQIYRRLFAPLLQEARFEVFRPIVASARKNKNLRCLRDIEQALINQPVAFTVTPSQYRSFGELTTQLVIDTYQHVSEAEQRRSTDRAYENGYFLDLVQQVQQLAAHIGSSDTSVEDGTQPTVDDEVTLEGGLSETGHLAELVRWKNGEGISLRTGLPYVPMAGMKRSASSAAPGDAQLSARRKKGVEYPVLHLPCDRCGKEFNRACDLAKHIKTHDRPYKCPEPGCKYHEVGLPTEKELDRHRNDKHTGDPKLYACKFCEFKTKRESNCKQHMEKKHGWNYTRSKGKDKGVNLTPGPTPNTPSLAYPSAEQSPMCQTTPWDAQSLTSSMQESPFQPAMNDFSFAQEYPNPLFPRRGIAINQANQFDFTTGFVDNEQLNLNTNLSGNGFDSAAYPTPASAVQHRFTPRTPAYSAITPSPMMMPDNNVPNYGCNNGVDLPTPESNPSHSRHTSFVQEMAPPAPMLMDNIDMTYNDFDLDMSNSMGTGQLQEDFQLFTHGAGAFTHEGAENATLFQGLQTFGEHEYTPDTFAMMDYTEFPEADPLFSDYQ